jgi:hypothetical protein
MGLGSAIRDPEKKPIPDPGSATLPAAQKSVSNNAGGSLILYCSFDL